MLFVCYLFLTALAQSDPPLPPFFLSASCIHFLFCRPGPDLHIPSVSLCLDCSLLFKRVSPSHVSGDFSQMLTSGFYSCVQPASLMTLLFLCTRPVSCGFCQSVRLCNSKNLDFFLSTLSGSLCSTVVSVGWKDRSLHPSIQMGFISNLPPTDAYMKELL